MLVKTLGAVSLIFCVLGQAPRTSKIVETGIFSDFSDRGGSWLGLYKSGNRFSVKPCRISTKSTKTEAGTGTKVSISPPGPIVAVKSPSPLRVGNVQTVFDGDLDELAASGATDDVRLGNRLYKLFIQKSTRDDDPTEHVVIRLGEKSQALEGVPSRDSQAVRWAGDLDGDGKLDLYLAVSHHNYFEGRYLYLSSMAKKNELVGLLGDLDGQKFE